MNLEPLTVLESEKIHNKRAWVDWRRVVERPEAWYVDYISIKLERKKKKRAPNVHSRESSSNKISNKSIGL